MSLIVLLEKDKKRIEKKIRVDAGLCLSGALLNCLQHFRVCTCWPLISQNERLSEARFLRSSFLFHAFMNCECFGREKTSVVVVADSRSSIYLHLGWLACFGAIVYYSFLTLFKMEVGRNKYMSLVSWFFPLVWVRDWRLEIHRRPDGSPSWSTICTQILQTGCKFT